MKFTNSIDLLNKAKQLIPLATQTFSKGYRYFPKGVSPIYIRLGQGSHIWDIDGNEYIDFICGLGPITLGWNYPAVNEAIKKQLKDGIIFSLPHSLEVELSELLVELIPCAEMIRFTKTGSEATSAAIRAARAYTGRDHIAFRGYHGWHEWYAITTEKPKGIPRVMNDLIAPFEYNSIDSLWRAFATHRDDIAAVIMEPVIVQSPENNFLQEVKELTHQKGAVLIFDEIVTGFRWSLSGAQGYFNVIPDLATFGKGMANGMPLNCIVGRRDIMKEFEDIFVSSTFGGECLSLAAGLATITEMKNKDTITKIWNLGEYLMRGLKDIGIEVLGYSCRPMIVFPDDPKTKSLWLQELIKQNILIHSGGLINLCYSHSFADIDKAITAFDIVLKLIKENKVELEGEIVQPAFRRL